MKHTSLQALINEKYEIFGHEIGVGSYGSVLSGKCKLTGRAVALKIIEEHAKSAYGCIKILREIKIMKKLHKLSSRLINRRGSHSHGGKTQTPSFLPELIDIIIPYFPDNKFINPNSPLSYRDEMNK